MEEIIKENCPNCNSIMYAEGVDIGVGYVYPPFHCECGYAERCSYESEASCRKCDQREYCFRE